MTLDIIIACLDDGNGYLQECLDSISAQAFKDIRIILEKDDPKDPKGVAAMRNKGLASAGSDYVMFMDCDDYLSRTALTSAMYEALKNPGSIIRIPRKRSLHKYSVQLVNEGVERDLRENLPGSFYDTCLGQLIPRRLLEGLSFEENYRYYSDIPFLARLYERTDVVIADDARYYKRVHNDPVNYPSLDQEINPERFTEYCAAMRLAAAGMSDPRPIRNYICQFLISRTIVGRSQKAAGWSDRDMNSFASLVAEVAAPAIEDFNGESKRVLTAFKKGKIKKVRRLIRLHHRRLKFHDLCRSAHQRRLLVYNKIFRKLPVKKDLVIFSSFFGRNYADSPRAIYEYMAVNYPGKKYVWALNNTSIEIPGHCKRVDTHTLKYFYYLAVAELFVTNVRQPEWYVKRKEAKILQTWHGTPLKRLVFDLQDVYAAKPLEYKRFFFRQACEWNALVSDNAFSTKAFRSAFRYPKEKIIETGYPRNDILFAPDIREKAEALKKKLGLPTNKKIVLYAPTWRDDETEGVAEYGFTLKLDLKKIKKLSDRYHFILRTHYLISENLNLNEDEKRFVTDLSSYNDIAELYLISDVLITDYSSTFFDYANLRRPILFYVYDLEKYRDDLHGFYFDMEEECPGPLLRRTEEVVDALRNIDAVSVEYAGKYAEFREKYCSLDDGHAAKRVVSAAMRL